MNHKRLSNFLLKVAQNAVLESRCTVQRMPVPVPANQHPVICSQMKHIGRFAHCVCDIVSRMFFLSHTLLAL